MTDSLHDIPPQERSSRPQTRTVIITVLVLAALLGGLFLWRTIKAGQGQSWQPQAVPVAAVVASPRDVPAGLEAVGTLTAVREVTLSPEVAGRVSALNITAGSQVRAGSLLVQLFDGPEQADRRAAQAKAAFAGVQLARSEQLAPTGAEPRELLQQRRAERDQTVAAVSQIDARIIQKQVRGLCCKNREA